MFKNIILLLALVTFTMSARLRWHSNYRNLSPDAFAGSSSTSGAGVYNDIDNFNGQSLTANNQLIDNCCW